MGMAISASASVSIKGVFEVGRSQSTEINAEIAFTDFSQVETEKSSTREIEFVAPAGRY